MDVKEVVKNIANEIRKKGISDDVILDINAVVGRDGTIEEIQLLRVYGNPTVWIEIEPPLIVVRGYFGNESYSEVINDNELAEGLFIRYAKLFEGLTIRS